MDETETCDICARYTIETYCRRVVRRYGTTVIRSATARNPCGFRDCLAVYERTMRRSISHNLNLIVLQHNLVSRVAFPASSPPPTDIQPMPPPVSAVCPSRKGSHKKAGTPTGITRLSRKPHTSPQYKQSPLFSTDIQPMQAPKTAVCPLGGRAAKAPSHAHNTPLASSSTDNQPISGSVSAVCP